MSALLRAKRALERRTGPVEFRRGASRVSDEHPVEVHGRPWSSDESDCETTWLGAGETHLDALSDVYDTLRARADIERRAGLADHLYERGEL